MNAVEAIREATAVGIQIAIDGNDLLLEAAGPPPMTVIELLSRHKPDIVNLLRSGDGSLADALAALDAGTDEAGHAFQFEAGRVFRSEAGHPWRQSHGSI